MPVFYPLFHVLLPRVQVTTEQKAMKRVSSHSPGGSSRMGGPSSLQSTRWMPLIRQHPSPPSEDDEKEVPTSKGTRGGEGERERGGHSQGEGGVGLGARVQGEGFV